MEQLPWHQQSTVHVHQYEKFLSHGGLGLLRIYENTSCPIPRMDKKQYNLATHAREGFIFLEIWQAIWRLPQAELLANKLLLKHLKLQGYYECVKWDYVT